MIILTNFCISTYKETSIIYKKQNIYYHIYKITLYGDIIICLFGAPYYKYYLMNLEL
jgi:hypothetical protein